MSDISVAEALENLRDLGQVGQGPLPIVKLTELQARQWEETRAALLWQAPAFTYLLINMMSEEGGKEYAYFTETRIPVAATDGERMIIRPSTYFGNYNLAERVFIACHEVLHAMFNHCGMIYLYRKSGKVITSDGKSLPFENKIMQQALDFVVNAIIVQSEIGKCPSGALYDLNIATHMDAVPDIYEKLYKMQQGGGGGKGGKGNGDSGSGVARTPDGKQGFDEHLDPGESTGKEPHKATQERDEGQWRVAVNAALDAAKAQGKMPEALERVMKEIIEPQVPWVDLVRGWAARRLGSGGSNWRRAERRLIVRDIYAPSRSSYACDYVAVGIDTSGSIGNDELRVFFGELSGILQDLKPRRLELIWCDAAVHKVDTIEDVSDLHRVKPIGGGGTDFCPVFEYVEKQDQVPDALIYLTDLYGPFPKHAPRYPVLWGRTHKDCNPPWGETVDVPIKRGR